MYRAWDIINKLMIYPGDRPFAISPWGMPIYKENHLYYMLMRKTGLRDIHDKPIYENDYVKYAHRGIDDWDRAITPIVWDQEKLRWVLDGGHGQVDNLSMSVDDENFEVVGNTYEGYFKIKKYFLK